MALLCGVGVFVLAGGCPMQTEPEPEPEKTAPTPTYQVEVAVAGQGTVILEPPGGTYEEGTVVTITAAPAEGYVFQGWSGDASGEEPTVTWAVYGDKTVTATFIVDTMAGTYTGVAKATFGDTSWNPKVEAVFDETNKLTSFTYHYFDGTSETMPFGDYSGWPRREGETREIVELEWRETIKCNSIDATPTSFMYDAFGVLQDREEGYDYGGTRYSFNLSRDGNTITGTFIYNIEKLGWPSIPSLTLEDIKLTRQ